MFAPGALDHHKINISHKTTIIKGPYIEVSQTKGVMQMKIHQIATKVATNVIAPIKFIDNPFTDPRVPQITDKIRGREFLQYKAKFKLVEPRYCTTLPFGY